jgi:adenosine/AMP kinase
MRDDNDLHNRRLEIAIDHASADLRTMAPNDNDLLRAAQDERKDLSDGLWFIVLYSMMVFALGAAAGAFVVVGL